MVRRLVISLACLATAGGCDSKNTSATPSATAPPPSTTAPAAGSVASSGAPVAPAPPALAGSWSGRFQARRTKIELPKDVTDKTWAKDDGATAVGEGTLELTVAADGEVSGSAKGPLGEVTVRGRAFDSTIRAAITPVDPNDGKSLTGFIVLDLEGRELIGALKASGPDAAIAREATLKLEKKL